MAEEKREETHLAIFHGKRIRRKLIGDKWFFSIVDIIGILTDSTIPKRYWSDLKIRLKEEGFESYDKIVQLKLLSSDGKEYETDCADAEGIFRIIQSIPSKRAEPFKRWLNKQVVVTLFEPSKEKIAQDIIEYLFEQDLNEEAKGIYLFGSYSRGDFDFNSDMDVLVITQNTNKLINHNNYEILLVSESSFSKNLPNNLNYLSILKEMKVIFNKELIEKYRAKKYKFNIKKSLLEIEGIFNINKDSVKMCKESKMNVPDGVVYSIVLRLRELYLIKCLFSNKSYHKKDFLELVGDKAYLAYLRIKRNEKESNSLSPDELISALELSEKWLKELKD